ncbi:sensor histidine kinase [Sphingomonas sp. PB4P5]|uniref:sensor histidine kinase n=1 Tax=Parasphingomonas puruogangriensis TaxID=3096155 RepID=UPI002FC9DA49
MYSARGRLFLIVLSCVALLARPATALPSDIAISQYKHTRWTVDDGLPGAVNALAQGRDGFLWVGTSEGLFRFDGLSFAPVLPDRQIGDRSSVTAVLVARDGSVWVGYAAGGIARYSGGVLRDTNLPRPTEFVQKLRQGRDGAIWGLLGRSDHQLVRFVGGKWEEVGSGWGLPVEQAYDLFVARSGALLLSTNYASFLLRPDSRRFDRLPYKPVGHAAFAEDAAGNIWVADQAGARALGRAMTSVSYPAPYGPRGVRAFFDRDGNLWGKSSEAGIYKVRHPTVGGERTAAAAAAKVDTLREITSLTADQVRAIIEDQEGSIWVGTSRGLERFRAPAVITEPLLTKVPMFGTVLLAPSTGDVFLGQQDGVYRVRHHGAPERVLSDMGEAEAMCEAPDGTVWMVMQRRIVRFGSGNAGELAKPTSRQPITDCAVDRRGTLFMTAVEGLFRRAAGSWTLLPVGEREQTGGAMPIVRRRDGSLLYYLSVQSLRLYDHPRYVDFTIRRPGALRQLRTFYEVPGSMLLGGGFGLARWRGNRVSFLSVARTPAFGSVTGIVSTPNRETWLIGRHGIVRVATAALERAFDDPARAPPVTVFDFRDGVPGLVIRDGKRDAVRGGDGRLWFATSGGTVWIDPARLPRNPVPPPVVIGSLEADGRTFTDPVNVVLRPDSARVTIGFAAPSLRIPERVRVFYRMDGADDGWLAAGSVRRATYTNLAPGTYRFQVVAANDDGVWNRSGATLKITIPPTFRESSWFVVLCAAITALMLWAGYSVRTRQLTARVRDRLEAKLAERERIARELHDTLLQGFQGLVLRFQSVANRMSDHSDSALRASLDQALEHAENVLDEGRVRVSDLRFAGNDADFAASITALAGKLGGHSSIPTTVTVEGHVRALDPMVREELLRIGEEAIANAMRHSDATRIEVEVFYDTHMRLCVRDDGAGLPPDIARRGERPGHFGLTGMRERAERAGGRFELATSPGQGTEICVSVPDRLAYRTGKRSIAERFKEVFR